MANLNVTDIVTDFGAYYLNSGQNVNDLLLPLRSGNDFYASLAKKSSKAAKDENSKWQRALVESTRVVQPWKSTFSPTDGGSLVALDTAIRTWKPDRKETPSESTHENWLQFLEDMDKTPIEWPFIKWYMEVHIMEQIIEDMNTTAWNGVYSAVAAGTTPGTLVQTVDGIKTKLAAHITSGYITPIANGAVGSLTESQYCEYIEDIVAQVSGKLLKRPCVLKLSDTNFRKYKRGYRALHGTDGDFKGQEGMIVDTGVKIEGYMAMNGSERVYITQEGNDVKVLPLKNEMGKIWLEAAEYDVKILGYGKIAFDFTDPRLVACNDLT
jgi:hypothetical protein